MPWHLKMPTTTPAWAGRGSRGILPPRAAGTLHGLKAVASLQQPGADAEFVSAAHAKTEQHGVFLRQDCQGETATACEGEME